MKLIAITGGIGVGKSTVSQILRARGYHVYDCDLRAREIIDSDAQIKNKILKEISPDAYSKDGKLDRPLVAKIVFDDRNKLQALNAITHKAVREDINLWSRSLGSPLAFVETAILYQSGLDVMVDGVWDVTAPEDLRIKRVMKRSGLTAQQVADRIAAQAFTPDEPHENVSLIVNDNRHSLLLQVEDLLICWQ
ncbi:MAG: dephospho-CoA kinase [Bacteroidales bacterium]|nr:dephospho-CoA kinase [Bacteroidales bacterium]